MEHSGHRQRLRARVALHGFSGMAPHEILEYLLCFAIPRRDVNPLAHQLIDHFGSLHAVLDADEHTLQQVPGVGPQAAAMLSVMPHLFRAYALDTLGEHPRLSSIQAAYDYCRNLFWGCRDEVLFMICLDTGGKLLHSVRLQEGTINEITVYPRKVVQAAIQFSAHAVILTHNHPSGITDPSDADVRLTHELYGALKTIEVELLDHVIVAGGECAGMRAKGLLRPASAEVTPAKAPLQAAEDASPVRGVVKPMRKKP